MYRYYFALTISLVSSSCLVGLFSLHDQDSAQIHSNKELFFLIGAPGSGKSTSGSSLAGKHPHLIAWYSAGDLLRAESSHNNNLKALLDAGKLVPIETALDIMCPVIHKTVQPIILIDGFLRTQEHAQRFEEFMSKHPHLHIKGVIEINVASEIAQQRALSRARSDDREEIVNRRIKTYLDSSPLIKEWYQSKHLLYVVDGNELPEVVAKNVETIMLH